MTSFLLTEIIFFLFIIVASAIAGFIAYNWFRKYLFKRVILCEILGGLIVLFAGYFISLIVFSPVFSIWNVLLGLIVYILFIRIETD